ncbi:hypothetical protein MNB_SV-6-589 [hydrothermal vent metagenome]|uniref:Uncharacterized protein n=1 Tax=hydrothermal vent metagenome TaxID=652676 RepID=A0A1W1CBU3_9ZZZZ
MKLLLKSFLAIGTILFFVACEDVNTLCMNDGKDTNETVDSNDTTDNNDTVTAPEDESRDGNSKVSYILHRDIKVSLFYVGKDNISSSAWDSDWIGSYGGIDEPDNRDGYNPASFTPNENPFYVALPYNDLDDDGGLRKSESSSIIPWATSSDSIDSSICKNRWVKITVDRRYAYAQWEDVKPNSTDSDYVFGSKAPSDSTNAGIFVSPAVRDYLNIDDNSSVEWQFVDYGSVASGPWKDIETK